MTFKIVALLFVVFLTFCSSKLVYDQISNRRPIQSEPVKPGIDGDLKSVFKNHKIGLFTNPSGVNYDLKPSLDVLLEHEKDFQLVALFAGEHGIRGDYPAGQHFQSYTDPITKLPVYSLYDGVHTAPTKEMLQNVTILAIDIQDVGARCFTYMSTMVNIMKSAAQFEIPFVVLDRPNPIGARSKIHSDLGLHHHYDDKSILASDVQGPVLKIDYSSFVGIWTIPMKHGMTLGELALLFNEEMKIGANVSVVRVQNYEDRLPMNMYSHFGWIPPSPNLPTLQTALFYPGMVLFEATTNVSLGRGTTTPFFIVGAPFVDPYKLIGAIHHIINDEDPSLMRFFSNVRLIPTFFTPLSSYHANKQCSGVRLVPLTSQPFEKDAVHPLPIDLTILRSLIRLYGTGTLKFSQTWFQLLTGTDRVYQQILDESILISSIVDSWNDDLLQFMQRREKYLLY